MLLTHLKYFFEKKIINWGVEMDINIYYNDQDWVFFSVFLLRISGKNQNGESVVKH